MMEEEQQQQFETIWSEQGHSVAQQFAFHQQLQACKEIESNVIWQCLNESIDSILSFCKDEYSNSGKNNHIISVTFRKNQMQEFNPFFSRIYDELEEKKTSYFEGLEHDKISVTKICKSDVREIVLHMYIYLEENPDFEVFVFLVESLTDLDENNIYCFEKGLKGKKFVAIIGTHHDFGFRSEAGLQNLEKFHYTLYNPRELFSKYLYRCLINNVIKPYLPAQILSLITDMDYYNISYHESCRRFMYCLERALLLGRWDRTYVDFDRLVSMIDGVIKNKFKTYTGAEIKKDKYLKVILDEKEIYTISERCIILQVAMAVGGPEKDKVKIEENIIINNIRDSLRKKFLKDERFIKYVDFLEDKEQNMQVAMRRKKTRADKLGIDMKKNITPKNKLQNQLTAILKSATQMIRKQSNHIRWDDIKFNLRIRPELPYLIKKDWQDNEKTEMLVEAITQNYSAPLTKYLKLFHSDKLGEGIYLIKCLQLAGLIDISKRSVKPTVTCCFFEKAVFSGKNT